MADEVTEWYPPDVKPVRRWWYECERCHEYEGQHYFNGKRWPISGNRRTSFPPFRWRGLRRKSK